MKGLSITGLVLGALAPIIVLMPLAGGLFYGENYWQAGWALFFVTVPVGFLFAVAGAALSIVAASIALRRGVRPRSIAITGICLAGSGLLLSQAGIWFTISGIDSLILPSLLGGLVCFLTGVIMCSISGLRAPQPYPRAYR